MTRTTSPSSKLPKWGIIVGILLVILAIGTACQPSETEEPTEAIAEEATTPPTDVPPTPLPDQSAMIADWESGAHGNTYDLGKGPNTYCSRCHSPQNWDPESKPGPPPTCITCKFPTDDEVRITPFMDFVEEADWVGITCATCHQVDENEIASEQLAWLNVFTGKYEEVNTPNELCTKCHLTSSGIMVTGGSGVTHEIYLGGSAHKNWAGTKSTERRPEYCSECHNPHSVARPQCEDCHSEVLESDTHIKGKNAFHTDVTCMACHDAEGYDVGPHPDEAMGGIWVLLETTMGRGGPSTDVVISHSPQWQVVCDRCHFEENPWELEVLTADGEVPEPEENGGS
ncbi:MAG: cytochrome c3 family protein [Anaerolineae bacterium]|nr:cytochrome c3 family protein [Anaerolineae bacterium]